MSLSPSGCVPINGSLTSPSDARLNADVQDFDRQTSYAFNKSLRRVTYLREDVANSEHQDAMAGETQPENQKKRV